MKRRDVCIQILHEVSGRPKEFVEAMFDASINLAPPAGQKKYFEEISDKEYEDLLNGLRQEKEGIADWLMRGNLDFVLRHGKPFGEA